MLAVVQWGWPVWLGVAAAVGVGIIVGLGNGASVAYGRAPAFIITLAIGSIALGIASGGRFLHGQGDGQAVAAPVGQTVGGYGQHRSLGVGGGGCSEVGGGGVGVGSCQPG